MVPTGTRTQQSPPPGTAIARSPGGGTGVATRSRARAVSVRLPTRGRSGIDGVPPEYDDGLQWLMNGWARHPIGVTVALLARHLDMGVHVLVHGHLVERPLRRWT